MVEVWRRAMVRDDWLVLNETTNKDDRQVESEMKQSCLFIALVQVMAYAQSNEILEVKLFSPVQILKSELFPLSLQENFDDSQRTGIRRDLEREQERVKMFIDKGQLEAHYGGLVSSAESLVREQADRNGEEMAATETYLDVIGEQALDGSM